MSTMMLLSNKLTFLFLWACTAATCSSNHGVAALVPPAQIDASTTRHIRNGMGGAAHHQKTPLALGINKPRTLSTRLSVFERPTSDSRMREMLPKDSSSSSNRIILPEWVPSPSSISEETWGLLALLAVPILWGTYTPAVRMLYEIDPPVPGFVFSASYFSVASLATFSLSSVLSSSSSSAATTPESDLVTTTLTQEEPKQDWSTLTAGMELGTLVFLANCLQVVGLETVPADRAGFLTQMSTVMVPVVSALLAGNLFAVDGRTWIGCLLALMGIVAMSFHPPNSTITASVISDNVYATADSSVDGLASASVGAVVDAAHTSANAVTQLAAATTAGEGVTSSSALASAADAFLPSLEAFSSGLSSGDWLMLASSLMYAINVIQIGRWAPKTAPLQLATYKTAVEAFWSVSVVAALMLYASITVGGDASSSLEQDLVSTLAPADSVSGASMLSMFAQTKGQEITSFFASLSDRISDGTLPMSSMIKFAGTTVWTGCMGTVMVIVAQMYGQRHVRSASDANLIYSLQPVFTALFAYLLLGETSIFEDGQGLLGGGLLLSAVLVVASKK